MTKLAVVKTGGKQYLVKEDQEIKIEKKREKKGQITFSDVLLYSDSKKTVIDKSKLKKVKVKGKIVEVGKDEKIRVIKFKPKKRQLKRKGHRQRYNLVKIDKIILEK